MVLVDTSAWIRFFIGKEPFRAEVDGLLAVDRAAGHPLVYGELLMGDVGGGRHEFLQGYETGPQAFVVPHEEVVTLVRLRRLQARGIGWIDAHLLASTLAGHMKLYTADERLAAVAEELGCAYKI